MGFINTQILLNKRIYPYAKTVDVIICPEGTSNEELEELYKSKPNKSFTLTESGKAFLNS